VKLVSAKADQVYRNTNFDELKGKLAEIKSKCDDFQFCLDSGVDQIKEHCIRLRTNVHLETDLLIEKAHQFNEHLISEIDNYEERCIESFSKKFYNQESKRFLSEMNKFCVEKLSYLNEFKLDEKVIDESIAKANMHLMKLKIEDRMLKKDKFDEGIMEFKNNQVLFDQSLLGRLILNHSWFDPTKLQEIKFHSRIDRGGSSKTQSFWVFKHDNGNNTAFYLDYQSYLSVLSFDNEGKIINEDKKVFKQQVVKFKITKSLKYFVFQATFVSQYTSAYVNQKDKNNRSYYSDEYDNEYVYEGDRNSKTKNLPTNLLTVTDDSVTFIKQLEMSNPVLHIASNGSSIFCIDSSHHCYFYNMELELVSEKLVYKIKEKVGKTIVDLDMNDEKIFVLCNNNKFKIFDFETFEVLMEVDTKASQIKLVSLDYLVLFDAASRLVYLYEQSGEFRKLDDRDFTQSLETGLTLSRDKSRFVSFYNVKSMKSLSIE
jgi:hypothetical protein